MQSNIENESANVGRANAQLSPSADSSDVEFSMSDGLVPLLENLGASLLVSSYQSGILYSIGRNPGGGLHVHKTHLPKPMGIVSTGNGKLVVATGHQIIRYENVLKAGERANEIFDACYLPRTVHLTGHLDAHDVGVDSADRPIFVNTRFNCLALVDPRHSFAELWRPNFIDALIDEDRCHLNGLAMDKGRPAFATAVSRSNTIDGWRDRRASGGIVICINSGEIICHGLSMPHSPRLYQDRLWVLNSGTGELGVLAKSSGQTRAEFRFEPVAFCPGFLRGLAFSENYAFVGLSKPRYNRFSGLELDKRLQEADSDPWCGIQVIDLNTGTCAEWFRIDGAVVELYDLEILHACSTPMAVAPGVEEASGIVTYELVKAA